MYNETLNSFSHRYTDIGSTQRCSRPPCYCLFLCRGNPEHEHVGTINHQTEHSERGSVPNNNV